MAVLLVTVALMAWVALVYLPRTRRNATRMIGLLEEIRDQLVDLNKRGRD